MSDNKEIKIVLPKSELNTFLMQLDWDIDKFLFHNDVDNYYLQRIKRIQRLVNDLKDLNRNSKGKIK